MSRRVARRPGPRRLVIEDQERRARLLQAVGAGIPLTQSALHAGFSDRTLFRLLAKGEAANERALLLEEGGPDAVGVEPLTPDEETCRAFWAEVRQTRAQVAVRNVALLQKAATGGYVKREKKRRYKDDSGKWVTETDTEYADVDWRAAKFLLETSFQRDFGPAAQRLEVSGPDGGAMQTEVTVDHIGALSARLREITAKRAADDAAGFGDGPDDVVDGEVVDDRDDGQAYDEHGAIE